MNKRIFAIIIATLVLTMSISILLFGCNDKNNDKDSFWYGLDTKDLTAVTTKVKEQEKTKNYTTVTTRYLDDGSNMTETYYVDKTTLLIERAYGDAISSEILTTIQDEDIKYARESKDAKWQYEKMPSGTTANLISSRNVDSLSETLESMTATFDKKANKIVLLDKEDANKTADIECAKDGMIVNMYSDGKKAMTFKIVAFGVTKIAMPEDSEVIKPNENIGESGFWQGVDKNNVKDVANKFLPAIATGNFAVQQYSKDSEESTNYNVTGDAVEAVTTKNGKVIQTDIYKKSASGDKTIKYTKKLGDATWTKVEDKAEVYDNLASNLTNLSPMLDKALKESDFTLDATTKKFVNADPNSMVMDIEVLDDGLLVHVNLANRPQGVAFADETAKPLDMYFKFTTIGDAKVEMPREEETHDGMWTGVDITSWKNIVDKVVLGFKNRNITAEMIAPATGEVRVHDTTKITANGVYIYCLGYEETLTYKNDAGAKYYRRAEGAKDWYSEDVDAKFCSEDYSRAKGQFLGAIDESVGLKWTYDADAKRFTCHLPAGSNFTFEYADILDDGVKVYFHDGDTLGYVYYHNVGSTTITPPKASNDNPPYYLHGPWSDVVRSDLDAVKTKYSNLIHNSNFKVKVTNSQNSDYDMYTFYYHRFIVETQRSGVYHADMYCLNNDIDGFNRHYSKAGQDAKWTADIIPYEELSKVRQNTQDMIKGLLDNIDVNAYQYDDATYTHTKADSGITYIQMSPNGIVIKDVKEDNVKTTYDICDIYDTYFDEPKDTEITNPHFNAWKGVCVDCPNEIFPKFKEYTEAANFIIDANTAYGKSRVEIDGNKIRTSTEGVVVEYMELTLDNKAKIYSRENANAKWSVREDDRAVFDERKSILVTYGLLMMSCSTQITWSKNGEYLFAGEGFHGFTANYVGAIINSDEGDMFFHAFGDVHLTAPSIS